MPDTETHKKQNLDTSTAFPRLLLSRSSQTTRNNKTGEWRFVRPVVEDKTAPCGVACPAGEDIPRIEMLASQGKLRQAWDVVMQENPFPAICGRVCFHPCEIACNRSELDSPLAIHHVEGALGEYALEERLKPAGRPVEKKEMRIAVVGAGPSGLSAAYFLNNLGYECHVYETHTEAGGLLRWGIPEYRLPLSILAGEVSRLEHLGVVFHCGTSLGKDFLETPGSGYQAVFVGCGRARSVFPAIQGREMMVDGLAYLRAVRDGDAMGVTGEVAVVGGGNTAIDVARTLIRFNARPTIFYRRRLQDMPAFEKEKEAALAEGVAIRELVAPVAVEAGTGGYSLTLKAMQPSGETDVDGRSRVVPKGEATEILTVQRVFAATGAEADAAWDPGRETDYGRLALSHSLLEARDIPVLYGGDLVNSVLSVPHAVMSGKQAAMVLDTYFRAGMTAIAPRLEACRIGGGPGVSMEKYCNAKARSTNPETVAYANIKSSMFEGSERESPPRLSLEECVQSFSAVEACLSKEGAIQEAGRCFNCGTCNGCGYCSVFCPEMAVVLGEPNTISLDYCKGCGICVEECPRNAMHLEAEAS